MKESKLEGVLKQLSQTAKDLTRGANSTKLVIDSLQEIHSEVNGKLATEEEKEKYKQFVKGTNEILSKAGKADYNDLMKSLQTLTNYGKDSSNKA